MESLFTHKQYQREQLTFSVGIEKTHQCIMLSEELFLGYSLMLWNTHLVLISLQQHGWLQRLASANLA